MDGVNRKVIFLGTSTVACLLALHCLATIVVSRSPFILESVRLNGGSILKHISIDAVFFPKGRSDVGIAKVHGKINGQYVAGDVRLRRIAHYHPETGEWTGVASPPPAPVKLHTSAVSQVVADSIAQALGSLVGGGAQNGDSMVPEQYVDPKEAMAKLITSETAQAIAQTAEAEKEEGTEGAGGASSEESGGTISAAGGQQNLRAVAVAKSLGGCDCVAPCTRQGRDRAWCRTAGSCGMGDAVRGGMWDFCEREIVTTVKGCRCKLPFKYKGITHTQCMDASRTFLWGAEPKPGTGPRGLWCVTEGDCGEGSVSVDEQGLVKWDHCELPPPAVDEMTGISSSQSQSLAPTHDKDQHIKQAQRRAPPQSKGMCGATIADLRRSDTRPFNFDSQCAHTEVCNYRCVNLQFCPTCAGGNCRCVEPKEKGAKCGSGTSRPPGYSNSECLSGRCVFACQGAAEDCADCNGGKCECR